VLSPLAMTKTSARVLALVTCLNASALLAGLTGCVGDRYHQSTGRSIDDNRTAEPDNRQCTDRGIGDNRTAERVREALAAGADYRYDGVKVIACGGVVQLNGSVNTRVQKNAAGEAASKVVGVKEVVNNIKVKG
jgi:hypothetical protein